MEELTRCFLRWLFLILHVAQVAFYTFLWYLTLPLTSTHIIVRICWVAVSPRDCNLHECRDWVCLVHCLSLVPNTVLGICKVISTISKNMTSSH